MKTRIKRIILSLIFVVLTITSICCLYKILAWKDTSGDYFSSLAELKQLPNNTVEVVALGSSKAYGTFDPSYLWEKEGIASFNLSIAGMAQQSAYYHLKELLKTQSPKVVFMEGSLLYTEEYLDQGNIYRNTIVMSPSKNNVDLIKATVERKVTLDYILRFPIVHSRYKELQKEDFKTSAIDKGRLGFIPGFDCMPQDDVDYSVLDNEEDFVEASEETKQWIKDLYELSVKEGFDLIFYLAPQNIIMPYKQRYNGACKILDEYEISHIDFNNMRDEIGLDYFTDLSDSFHSNDKGAKKIMNYLCTYLKEHYDLQDNRGNEAYCRWDKNTYYIYNERLLSELSNLEIDEAHKLLEQAKDVIIVDMNSNSVIVSQNGLTVFELIDAPGEYSQKINNDDYLYITSVQDGSTLNTIAYLGQIPYYMRGEHENLCVAYDGIREEVIYCKEY